MRLHDILRILLYIVLQIFIKYFIIFIHKKRDTLKKLPKFYLGLI